MTEVARIASLAAILARSIIRDRLDGESPLAMGKDSSATCLASVPDSPLSVVPPAELTDGCEGDSE